jgi:hypothetical protein
LCPLRGASATTRRQRSRITRSAGAARVKRWTTTDRLTCTAGPPHNLPLWPRVGSQVGNIIRAGYIIRAAFFLSTSRSRDNKSNFAQPDEDRPAIRNRRTRGTDTFLTLPTQTDQILVPCRVNRTFRPFEKLKISQPPQSRSGVQLSRPIPVRSLTRSADVISPDTTVPRIISLFASQPDLRRKPGPTSPRSIEFSAVNIQLHICACLLLIILCFGLSSSISPSGRERSSTSAPDATTRAPPDDGGTPSISHSIQHTLLSVL